MNNERHKVISAVHLILEQDDQILLLQRQNTGFEDGKYSVVAGHIDANEPARSAMVREAKEEAAIDIHIDDLEIVHVMHKQSRNGERIYFFIRAHSWKGEPKNAEPDKCSDLSWFKSNELPENMIEYVKTALEHIKEGRHYSELGW